MLTNNKGQALIEFILILPIFLMLIFVAIDFGVIFNAKNHLENVSSDIINTYKKDKNIDSLNNIYSNYTININNEGEYSKITIVDNVNLITPGLNRILPNPYELKIERIIMNE